MASPLSFPGATREGADRKSCNPSLSSPTNTRHFLRRAFCTVAAMGCKCIVYVLKTTAHPTRYYTGITSDVGSGLSDGRSARA